MKKKTGIKRSNNGDNYSLKKIGREKKKKRNKAELFVSVREKKERRWTGGVDSIVMDIRELGMSL